MKTTLIAEGKSFVKDLARRWKLKADAKYAFSKYELNDIYSVERRFNSESGTTIGAILTRPSFPMSFSSLHIGVGKCKLDGKFDSKCKMLLQRPVEPIPLPKAWSAKI